MKKISEQSGFTLIEIIVSLGVFSTVVTIAVGALLVLVAANQQLQVEQSVMSNLSFALDSMTREIRTGTSFYCDTAPNEAAGNSNIFDSDNNLDEILDTDEYNDCTNIPTGHVLRGLSFVESGDSISGSNDRVLYFFDGTEQAIFRRVGNDDPLAVTSSSSGAVINDFKFWVTGSEPLEDGDIEQPTVTIFIDAVNASDPTKHYYLQTTVTQRTLDL